MMIMGIFGDGTRGEERRQRELQLTESGWVKWPGSAWICPRCGALVADTDWGGPEGHTAWHNEQKDKPVRDRRDRIEEMKDGMSRRARVSVPPPDPGEESGGTAAVIKLAEEAVTKLAQAEERLAHYRDSELPAARHREDGMQLRIQQLAAERDQAIVDRDEHLLELNRLRQEIPLPAHPEGCCTTCQGTGTLLDPSTNGRCWDCVGTGHPHDPSQPCGRPPRYPRTARGRTLDDMSDEVLEINVALGWRGPGAARSFGDEIALLHSEVSEALEAYREHGTEDATGPIYHAVGCPIADHIVYGMPGSGPDCTCGAVAKPEGVGSEFADVLIRLLDTARQYGIDLQAEYDRKVAFNRTRPHRHGGKRL